MTAVAGSAGGPRSSNRNKYLLLGGVVLLAIGGAAFLVLSSSSPPPTGEPSFMQATCSSVPQTNGTQVEHVASGGSGGHAYFLIVEGDYPSPYGGLNGSLYVPTTTQWPIMNVKVGQVVSIHVINCAPSEPHGFQITYYDDIQQNGQQNLVTIPAGQSYDVTFTATEAGTFRVYCGIFCSIHPSMQNGALVVS
ncbi:MAG: hypothetical protein JRN57_01050 [Nitrososphaerota archaeon]|nr:hypothetical protein [Nitrososphaerota archaeon]MDG7010682.1 hypothetical protein [Nitrososphaerota archaeon]